MTDKELINQIRSLSKKVAPSNYFMAMSRDKIYGLIEMKRSAHSGIGSFWKKWVSVAVLCTLVTFIVSPILLRPDVAKAYIGEAKVVHGVVTLLHQGERSIISSTASISVGDTIVVSDQSEAQIQFIDDSRVVLYQGTIVAVDNVLINPYNVRNSIVSVVLEQGEMVSSVNKKEGGDLAKMRIQTDTSVVEAQDSNFSVRVTGSGETEVTALKNSVTVQAIDKSNSAENKVVIAEAQAMEGYKVRVAKKVNHMGTTPIAIATEKQSPIISTNTNVSEDSTTGISEQYSLVVAYMEIARVKIYQALQFINEQKQDDAIKVLTEYQTKLLQAYNILTSGNVSDTIDRTSLSTILRSSRLSDISIAVSAIQNLGVKQKCIAIVSLLQTLEKGLLEKNGMIAQLDEDINSSSSMTEEDNNAEVLKKIHGQLSFEVTNLKNLIQMNTALDASQQKDIENIIQTSIISIANHINAIEDWKEQQNQMKYTLSLFPNKKIYEDVLQQLRALASDRISFLISNKLQALQ